MVPPLHKELPTNNRQLFVHSMKRVALHTLGCKLNFAETSTIGKQFAERGFNTVHLDDPADVVVINTCSVTERADRECRQLVRRALRHSPNAFVVIVGCYAQLQPEEIAAIPGVDLVLGTSEKLNVFDHVPSFQKQATARVVVGPINETNTFSFATSAGFSDRTRAFLKVQDGCDYSCSFCTIPLARGNSRSVSVDEVLREAKNILAQGYKEIVLTGVNVGDYGKKNDTSLLDLLKEMSNLHGLRRLRVSSIEPNLLTDDLLTFWLSSDVLCKHFHIPLQSGSDEILKSMRRRYRTEKYAEVVNRIKSVFPDAGIGADVMSGFPGESEALFEETYKFLRELPLSYIHPFTYSERPNTSAPSIASPVEPRIRFKRTEMLRNLSVRKRRVFNESFVNKTVEVLFETRIRGNVWSGLTGEYVKVAVESEEPLGNQLRSIKIETANEESCLGRIESVVHSVTEEHLDAA